MPVSPFIFSAMVGGSFSFVNGIIHMRQQNKLSQESQKAQAAIQENRQNFDLKMHENNIENQRELSLKNHTYRLEEQLNQFHLTCNQFDYKHFLDRWPLVNLPEIIREEQILSDNTVALRVIFSKSNDEVFSKYVFPRVEYGLLDFVDLYHNKFNSNNIVFYHNGYTGNIAGGAVVTNIHSVLKELPVIIIDSAVVVNELRISFSMWGLGSSELKHNTVFRMPYRKTMANGLPVPLYYDNIVEKILAHLKFLLGYSYDMYNMLEYNRPPLLPQIASYELENPKNIHGIMLKNEEVVASIAEHYEDMYSKLIGAYNSVAMLPESNKETLLHKLRAEYAQSMKGFIPDKQYLDCVNESLDAWVNLRSEQTAEEFLNSILSNEELIKKYFSNDDKEFFVMLNKLYENNNSSRANLVCEICKLLEQIELEPLAAVKPVVVSTPSTETPLGNRRSRLNM